MKRTVIRPELRTPIIAAYASPAKTWVYKPEKTASAEIGFYPAHIDQERVCSFTWRYDDPKTRFYDYLKIRHQVFSGSGTPTDIRRIAPEYHDSRGVNVEVAQRMSATLTRIDRKIDDWYYDNKNYSKPAINRTLEAFAFAIGADQVWIWAGDRSGRFVTVPEAIEWYKETYARLWLDCHLLAGDFSGGLENCALTGWTDAPKDYDGFGTETIEVKPDTNKRKVKIPSHNYNWQVGRYQSGLHHLTEVEIYQEEPNDPAVSLHS